VLIAPMRGALGADVTGVDVGDLDSVQLASILAAIGDRHVIAIRDQRLDPTALSRFAARLGEREIYPFAESLPEDPYVVPIVKEPQDASNFGGMWHTDSSYLPRPPGLTLLYAVTLPRSGGDTLFANMHAAYHALPAEMRAELDGMTAQYTASLVHDDAGAYAQVAGANRNRRAAGSAVTDAVHPVVRTHPHSGAKALYVSLAHTRCFTGRTRDDSLPLLTQLARHATRDDFCVRLRWSVGTLAIWDNRSVQHFPLNDYPGERRVMHRVILRGERPE
jgi:alpha-ketoglutarate-dependent taurine dioxygenase